MYTYICYDETSKLYVILLYLQVKTIVLEKNAFFKVRVFVGFAIGIKNNISVSKRKAVSLRSDTF